MPRFRPSSRVVMVHDEPVKGANVLTSDQSGTCDDRLSIEQRCPGPSHHIPLMSSKESLIKFTRSDGSVEKLPTDKLDQSPSKGEINYMRPVDLKESLSVKWRTAIGRGVAKLMEKLGMWFRIFFPGASAHLDSCQISRITSLRTFLQTTNSILIIRALWVALLVQTPIFMVRSFFTYMCFLYEKTFQVHPLDGFGHLPSLFPMPTGS